MNVMMLLEMAVGAFGDRVAVGSRGGSAMTYQELFSRAGAAADEFGRSEAHHIGYLETSSTALPIALFGAAWAGRPFVPLNYRLPADEIRSLAAPLAPAVVIAEGPEASALDDVVGIETMASFEFLTGLDSAAPSDPDWRMDPDDIAVLLYTSGTTGPPKAAVIRHRHLVSYILGSVEFMGAGEDEANLVAVPPYHIAGIAALCSSIYAGRRIVQLPNFDADQWIDTAREEGISHAMVVPTMLARVVERLADRGEGGIDSLRALSYGGGRMPRPLIERALELLPGTDFVNAYGLTETSSTIAVLGSAEHRDAIASDDERVRARLASVGIPLPMIEVSIRDEDGHEVAPAVSGEIWVRGEQVSGEYLGRDSRVTSDGWLPTNDGGTLDEDGYLYVEGRLDDIIIRGGENISPGEIEDVLVGLDEIRAAAAVGIPDEQWGEVIGVALVLQDGSEIDDDTVKEFLRDRMRSSRVPDRVVMVEDLPYNEMGKLLRRALRELFVK